MKFKVGDKVKVIKLDDIDGIEAYSKSKYTNYIGKTGEIIRYKEKNDHQYRVAFTVLDDEWFSTKELELIEPTPKSLLKDGVIATLRCGEITTVLKDKLLFYTLGSGGNYTKNYNENLEYDNGNQRIHEQDIIKLEFDGNVIWDREHKPTDEEIEKLNEYIKNQLDLYKKLKKIDCVQIAQLELNQFIEKWGNK